MNTARLAARQVRYATLSYVRNPPAVFFGLLMPVLFLAIFATVFGNDTIDSRGGISQSTYYVPGLVALGIVSTTFVNLSMSLVVLRENRVLKRLRGTPLPAPAFLAGRAGHRHRHGHRPDRGAAGHRPAGVRGGAAGRHGAGRGAGPGGRRGQPSAPWAWPSRRWCPTRTRGPRW